MCVKAMTVETSGPSTTKQKFDDTVKRTDHIS